MDTDLVKLLLDAGVGVVAIAVISFLFYKTMQAHRVERREWNESAERQSEKVSTAISELAHSINTERLRKDGSDSKAGG